jgi:N-methylhydantoinase B
MAVQALSPFSLTTRIDRMHCKPWGLDGGHEAAMVELIRDEVWACEARGRMRCSDCEL